MSVPPKLVAGRWLRFSLRTFLLLCVALAIGLGWLGNLLVRVRHQRQIVARIQAAGGDVRYDYELVWERVDNRNRHKPPPGPKLLRWLLGDDAFAYIEYVHFNYNSRFTDADLKPLAELPRLRM